ncbi:copper resistance CopC family protein [Microbacterium sp.]|uniref:copper resistance CopC family protein n=1 Tax=Microbacterium sp. TaxID=51671 RepID=UPI00273741B8|nr:copper resistance CopC family protein [Microbacterium sp.]MDP3951253.1 copper resistance protein CopC [Microbacterium sp.]
MRTLTLRRSPAPFALATTLLVAFFLLFAWPQSAAAHDSLIDSDPAADSTVETLPSELTLTFSAAPIGGDGSTDVVVIDSEGNDVTDGAPTLDGAMVVQPLMSEAAAGEYHVIWKIVSSDGHPTSGEFSFSVSSGTAGETPPSGEPTAAPDETSTADTTAPTVAEDPNMTSGFAVSAPWLIGAAVILLIVAFVVIMLVRSRRRSNPPPVPTTLQSDRL